MLVNPRLGSRRCNGICPPSKPRIRRDPERDPWPLWPRVDVLPMPLPIPRPMRLRFAVAPFGGLNVERLVGTCFLFLRSPALQRLLGCPVHYSITMRRSAPNGGFSRSSHELREYLPVPQSGSAG